MLCSYGGGSDCGIIVFLALGQPSLEAVQDLGRLLRARFKGLGGDRVANAVARAGPNEHAIAEAARKPVVVDTVF